VFPSAFHSASNLGTGDWGVPICIPFGQQFGFWYPSAFHSASNLGTGDWGVPICIPFSQQFGYWRLGCGCSHLHSIQPAIWVLETGVFPSAFHSASNLGTGDWGVPICIPFGQQFGYWTGVFPSAFHSASNLGSGTHLHSIQPAIFVRDRPVHRWARGARTRRSCAASITASSTAAEGLRCARLPAALGEYPSCWASQPPWR
jgi:hypothetical protein